MMIKDKILNEIDKQELKKIFMLDEDFKLSNIYFVWYSIDNNRYETKNFDLIKSSNKIFKRFEIVFRDNKLVFELEPEKFLYFSYGITKELSSDDEIQNNFIVFGYQNDGEFLTKKWIRIPELIVSNSKIELINSCPKKCLHYNGKVIQ